MKRLSSSLIEVIAKSKFTIFGYQFLTEAIGNM